MNELYLISICLAILIIVYWITQLQNRIKKLEELK
jgi:hypothetical protein